MAELTSIADIVRSMTSETDSDKRLDAVLRKGGRKLTVDGAFARAHGMKRREAIMRLGGVKRLAAMKPEAANLMLSLLKKSGVPANKRREGTRNG